MSKTDVVDDIQMPTVADVYITTSQIQRKKLIELPYGHDLVCDRSEGWTLHFKDEKLAGEFAGGLLIVDVGGVIICNSIHSRRQVRDSPRFAKKIWGRLWNSRSFLADRPGNVREVEDV